jgi:hypothetical protein
LIQLASETKLKMDEIMVKDSGRSKNWG